MLKKSDKLNGELRGFFEQLKSHVKAANKDPNATFFAKDIRKAYRIHPMQLTRHLIQLERRGYIKQVSSNRKTGFEYQVTEWEEYSQLQEGVNILDTILAKLKPAKNKAVIPQLMHIHKTECETDPIDIQVESLAKRPYSHIHKHHTREARPPLKKYDEQHLRPHHIGL
jgi:DNA-binding MarR family transcriptional regulator